MIRDVIYLLIIIVVTVLLSILLWQNPFLLTIALLIVSIFILLFYRSKENLLTYIIIAIVGTLVEMVAVSFGIWIYTTPQMFGVPLWLPMAWGIVGVFVKETSMVIREFLK